MSTVIELILADGRFPGGSFAHSGGLEAAVGHGAVHDCSSLELFLLGRLYQSGPLDGWLAARACAVWGGPPEVRDTQLVRLEAEAESHQPSPALRAASRAQGRGLRRAAAVVFRGAELGRAEVHPVVLGVVAAAAGLDRYAAARLAVTGGLLSAVSAAPKLVAIDMADAMAVAASLAPAADAIAADAASADEPLVRSAPLAELRADRHVTWEVRLFAS